VRAIIVPNDKMQTPHFIVLRLRKGEKLPNINYFSSKLYTIKNFRYLESKTELKSINSKIANGIRYNKINNFLKYKNHNIINTSNTLKTKKFLLKVKIFCKKIKLLIFFFNFIKNILIYISKLIYFHKDKKLRKKNNFVCNNKVPDIGNKTKNNNFCSKYKKYKMIKS
ncbi:MAG: hypothetical protein N4P92_01155, partial [Candidatus Lightella neohaematopini]|nr:hypothetical protein [Candidatus Lightella neohaematopini]